MASFVQKAFDLKLSQKSLKNKIHKHLPIIRAACRNSFGKLSCLNDASLIFPIMNEALLSACFMEFGGQIKQPGLKEKGRYNHEVVSRLVFL